ncbi:hypothetical protein BCR43DRAFT_536603 [Syncephalastrum racemosum]|uniref:RlpA-like double-psi beta-barrel-protein domain-containing protein-containing protein n=1 Tax=Syncephalastrum racemosum TaxID=13706 RepID=A0A1X2HWE2_SYNRA|nr:hypothetical protein BCR43DRAFT_536603 [Syncephalastrum racemosum]
MLFKSFSFLLSVTTVALAVTLEGSATITPQDYESLIGAVDNPPACGQPYSSLDLTRITAVEKMDRTKTCNLCLKVTNAVDTSKSVYVLAVDLGGVGLDRYDPSPATWTTVDDSHCAGIYNNGTSPATSPASSGSSPGDIPPVSSASAASPTSPSSLLGYNHRDRHVSHKKGESTVSQKQAASSMTPPKNNSSASRPTAPAGYAIKQHRPRPTSTAPFLRRPSSKAGHGKMPSSSSVATPSITPSPIKHSSFLERFYRRAIM